MKSPSLKEVRRKVEALEKEIHLQRSILEVIEEAFFILDRKGEFLKANPKGMEMLDYPWDELQKMAFIDAVALEDLSRIREGFEEMEQDKEARFRTHVMTRRGERIPVEFTGIIKGETFFITLRDLRERIEAEEEWERTKKELAERIRERDQYARELQMFRDLYEDKLKEIEKLREEAILLSYTDDLTGIYNHRFFSNNSPWRWSVKSVILPPSPFS
jgi:PAS domain S-box-containing protein